MAPSHLPVRTSIGARNGLADQLVSLPQLFPIEVLRTPIFLGSDTPPQSRYVASVFYRKGRRTIMMEWGVRATITF
jgi:hypothetical protein